MTELSDRQREAVAIGAAIGAGCRPCTQYHVKAALKAGLTADELRRAVRDAETVRVDAAVAIAEYAAQLLGDPEKHGQRLCSPAESQQALVQVGAAVGSNAGYLLDSLLTQSRGLGLSNEALRETVAVANKVKSAAAGFFERDAERALGREESIALVEDGGCLPAAVPRATGEVGSAPVSCC
jgi:AhpD family alkylhydroperoxidase